MSTHHPLAPDRSPTTRAELLTRTRPIAAEVGEHADAAVCDLDGEPVVWARLGSRTRPQSIGAAEAAVARAAIDDAVGVGLPLVLELCGATVVPSQGISALDAWGSVAFALTAASGVVPTVAIVDGPVVTGLALALGLVDVVVVTDRALAYVSGPAAVATMTGRRVEHAELGGPRVHATTTGVAHLTASDVDHAFALVADLLAHLPANNAEAPPTLATADPPDRSCSAIAELVPADARRGYDVRHVIAELVDDRELLELAADHGRAMVCGLARLGGHPVGVVANQPAQLAGAIDIDCSQKAARFVQWCDAFGVPLLTLVDTPGYLPGRDLEWDGMIRYGGQLAFAYAAASVPRICVIMRKAYGGAYIVMDAKTMGNDLCVAWPSAEIAVMGAAGAVQILDARRLAGLPAGDAEAERSRLEAAYTDRYLNPHDAASRGFVDAVIEIETTRSVLCRALPSLLGKRPTRVVRKHHNGPL